jgi:hypothetical protein
VLREREIVATIGLVGVNEEWQMKMISVLVDYESEFEQLD